MRVYVVTMSIHVDACVAKTWISYRCVPCHPWCTHRHISSGQKQKTFSVFLWLWTIVIVINVSNHGEHYETPCVYIRENDQQDAHLLSLIYPNQTILYTFRTNNCSPSAGYFSTRNIQYCTAHLLGVWLPTRGCVYRNNLLMINNYLFETCRG
jgi:hypothetical protein